MSLNEAAVLDAAAEVETTTSTLAEEAERRRTFAIISHPDAGKTTLTEKLLLYGGAVQLAGSVTARRSGLDGNRARARDLDLVNRARISLPRAPGQSARYARSPGLLRRHLPHLDRGR